MRSPTLAAAIAASLLSATATAADCANIIAPAYQTPSLADGWAAQLIVKDLKKPRTIAFDTSGNLLVVESGKGISRVTFKDNGGTCLEVDRSILLIDNKDLNHGLTFSDDGKTLYASTVESVFAWEYDATKGTVGSTVKTVVSNMSNNELVTRTLLMSKKEPGKLIVTRGADENNDVDAMDVSTGLSQIRVFDTSSPPSSGTFNFNTDGTVLGWGLRNAVGVAEDPVKGNVYSVEASVDDITRDGTDVHQNNPGEELNAHGTIGDLKADSQGPNYGYPVCYALWDANIPDGGNLKVGDQFSMISANDSMCSSEYEPPRLTFQAHTSPLNLLFSEDGKELYLSFHGSFNRENPVGYTLSLVDFSDGEPIEPADSKNAQKDVMWNPTQSDCPDNCFRPVGLAWDAQGRLWMTSDSTGEIFVLQKGGSSTGFASPTATDSSSSPSTTNSGSRDVAALAFAGAAALIAAFLMA